MIVIGATTATANGDLENLAISIVRRRLCLIAAVGLFVTALGIDNLLIVMVIIITILLASSTMSPSSLLTSILSCYPLIMLIIDFIHPFNVRLDNRLYPSSCRRESNLFSRITYVNDNKDDAQGSAHQGSTIYYPRIHAPSMTPPYRCSPSHFHPHLLRPRPLPSFAL